MGLLCGCGKGTPAGRPVAGIRPQPLGALRGIGGIGSYRREPRRAIDWELV